MAANSLSETKIQVTPSVAYKAPIPHAVFEVFFRKMNFMLLVVCFSFLSGLALALVAPVKT